MALATACGDRSGEPSEPPGADPRSTRSAAAAYDPATETANPGPIGAIVLATKEFELPFANSLGVPGFHQFLTATHNLPSRWE